MATKFQLQQVRWQDAWQNLQQVRYRVFVCELRVDPRSEFDGLDEHSWHVLACDKKGRPIGSGRLCRNGKIGRIAVLMEFRNQGLGSAITRKLLKMARKQSLDDVYMAPELNDLPRFSDCAACPVGPVFMEEGIPHQQLMCSAALKKLPDLPYLH
ncbi:GNAT family N-acetyltransferase [Neiella marina]|uniref:GNAT family N-acetyltransferase n=1 Tax=Neiella holothuriorum TaxID=2870530 RepID=A0ABS7EJD7_9GAMM|nr:GNAT family N-acetyltransferase [Neiella holothuriorum]MBW8192459.1 GNAT family N-acetyltransferase [Neiella holothuriorum]